MASEQPSAPVGVPLGEVIGGYRLIRLIGAGSTSHVYLGQHARLGRPAAIKVLNAELVDNPRLVQRMLTEARVVNDIRHPNIVDIIDFVDQQAPRRVALVMEYIAGPSVESLRGGDPLPWRQATGIARQLVEAVEAAHRAGVIHRDLKPDNLLLASDPRSSGVPPQLKVVDFGIAKVAGPSFGHQTATQTMLGTPAYMAPEQIAQSPPPSAATDVFAVGEILYELWSGQRAYGSSTLAEVVRQKLRGEIPNLALPAIPGRSELQALIRRCLAFRPAERPRLVEVVGLLSAMEAMPAEDPDTDPPGDASADGWDDLGTRAAPTDPLLAETTELNAVVGFAGQQTQALWRPEEAPSPDEVTAGPSSATHMALSPEAPMQGAGTNLQDHTEPVDSAELEAYLQPSDDPTIGRPYDLDDDEVAKAETAMSAEAIDDEPAPTRRPDSGTELPTRDVLPSIPDGPPLGYSAIGPAETAISAPPEPPDLPPPPPGRVPARDGGPPVAPDDPLAQPWPSTVIRPERRDLSEVPTRRVSIEKQDPKPMVVLSHPAPARGSAPSSFGYRRTASGARREASMRWPWLLAPAVLLVIAAVLLVLRSDRPDTDRPVFRGPASAAVEVRSQPPEAFVEDAETGDYLGKTPVSVDVPHAGERKIRVIKAGYTARVVTLTADAPSTWVPLTLE